jgi:phosphopantothenoylcysteine decarboxylase/phosphopantothenate--cysteine ligase
MPKPPLDEAGQPIDLSGYEVLVCVCGGIAAYKVCAVVSELAQRGAGVSVAMSEAAAQFVQPLTFEALSGRRVLTNLWQAPDAADVQHIRRTEEADLLIVAPATANILGKIANGIADDVVSTLVISAASPVLLVPAMNNRMWDNPIAQRNVQLLRELGYHFLGPASGWLACRSVGPGRMVEAREVIDQAVAMLKSAKPKSAK